VGPVLSGVEFLPPIRCGWNDDEALAIGADIEGCFRGSLEQVQDGALDDQPETVAVLCELLEHKSLYIRCSTGAMCMPPLLGQESDRQPFAETEFEAPEQPSGSSSESWRAVRSMISGILVGTGRFTGIFRPVYCRDRQVVELGRDREREDPCMT